MTPSRIFLSIEPAKTLRIIFGILLASGSLTRSHGTGQSMKSRRREAEMFVRLQAAVILILLIALGYLTLTHHNKVAALRDRVRLLESAAAQREAECESRIASLRAGGSGEAKRVAVPPRVPLAGLVSRLPMNPETVRGGALAEMKQALALESAQVAGTEQVLHEFHLERSRIVSEASGGKTLPFGPDTVRAVDRARKDAMDRLKDVLTEEQYRGMVANGYDRRLGLRAATN